MLHIVSAFDSIVCSNFCVGVGGGVLRETAGAFKDVFRSSAAEAPHMTTGFTPPPPLEIGDGFMVRG
jgi:hypothetical protein